MKKNGIDVWMWKYDGDLTTAPTKIIFNNGGSCQQTKDLNFVNGAVYNRDGKTNEVYLNRYQPGYSSPEGYS